MKKSSKPLPVKSKTPAVPPRHWYTLDLLTCTSASCQALAQRISTHYSRLDGVLHNAGLLGEVRPMDEQDPEIWQQVMQVNVNGTFFLTRALLPLLLNSDSGSLVFTSSSVGRQGRANWGLTPPQNLPPKE